MVRDDHERLAGHPTARAVGVGIERFRATVESGRVGAVLPILALPVMVQIQGVRDALLSVAAGQAALMVFAVALILVGLFRIVAAARAEMSGRVGAVLPVPAVVVLLQAQEAMDALFAGGLATIIQFILLAIATFLTIGALFLVGAAGLSVMSQDTSRQQNVSTYLAGAAIMIALAAVVGVGPEVLSALGFETMQNISAVQVFAG